MWLGSVRCGLALLGLAWLGVRCRFPKSCKFYLFYEYLKFQFSTLLDIGEGEWSSFLVLVVPSFSRVGPCSWGLALPSRVGPSFCGWAFLLWIWPPSRGLALPSQALASGLALPSRICFIGCLALPAQGFSLSLSLLRKLFSKSFLTQEKDAIVIDIGEGQQWNCVRRIYPKKSRARVTPRGQFPVTRNT